MKRNKKEHNHSIEAQQAPLLAVLFLFLQAFYVQAQDEYEELPISQVMSTSQIQLAQEYLATNPEQATEIARQINFLPESDYEDPSNMCGPLAGIILFRAGIWQPSIIGTTEFEPHDFWKLDPVDLPSIFPPEYFINYSMNVPIWEIDYSIFSLELGDFLYLQGGTFDHMLAITRIDRSTEGYRAYSVTNIHTENGFVIEEVLLFDTTDDEAGIFRNDFRFTSSWTGQTGAQRLYVYRRN